jgi:hypothetical protein
LSRLPPGLADHGILAAHRIQESVDHTPDQNGHASQIDASD